MLFTGYNKKKLNQVQSHKLSVKDYKSVIKEITNDKIFQTFVCCN